MGLYASRVSHRHASWLSPAPPAHLPHGQVAREFCACDPGPQVWLSVMQQAATQLASSGKFWSLNPGAPLCVLCDLILTSCVTPDKSLILSVL